MSTEARYGGLESKLVRIADYERFFKNYRDWRDKGRDSGVNRTDTSVRMYCRNANLADAYEHIVRYGRARKEFGEYIDRHKAKGTLNKEVFPDVAGEEKDPHKRERYRQLEALLFGFYSTMYTPSENTRLLKSISTKKIEEYLASKDVSDLTYVFRLIVTATNKDNFASPFVGNHKPPRANAPRPANPTPPVKPATPVKELFPAETVDPSSVETATMFKEKTTSKVYAEKVLRTPIEDPKPTAYSGTLNVPCYIIASDEPLPEILVEEIKLKAKFHGILENMINPALNKEFAVGAKTVAMVFICVPGEFDKEVKDHLSLRGYSRQDVTVFPDYRTLMERSPFIETKNRKEPL